MSHGSSASWSTAAHTMRAGMFFWNCSVSSQPLWVQNPANRNSTTASRTFGLPALATQKWPLLLLLPPNDASSPAELALPSQLPPFNDTTFPPPLLATLPLFSTVLRDDLPL
uniref:(northern house mosquito) hypothetical protein n=1 Tax=Culex pipiens TaxID=7175 RepID=A0A8D8HZ29_CULPI